MKNRVVFQKKKHIKEDQTFFFFFFFGPESFCPGRSIQCESTSCSGQKPSGTQVYWSPTQKHGYALATPEQRACLGTTGGVNSGIRGEEGTHINTRGQIHKGRRERDRDVGITLERSEGKLTRVKKLSYQSLLDEQAE